MLSLCHSTIAGDDEDVRKQLAANGEGEFRLMPGSSETVAAYFDQTKREVDRLMAKLKPESKTDWEGNVGRGFSQIFQVLQV